MIAVINTAAAGDTTIVAAVPGKKIRIDSFEVVNQVATANAVKFRSGATDLHAALPLPLVIGGKLALHSSDDPGSFLFETVAGALLAINLSAATAVTGLVDYSLE